MNTIINIYLILILLQFPCSAIETQDDKYTSFALESFFNMRGSSTNNQIYSPLGVDSCVSALTHMLQGQEKIELETAIKNNGINHQQLFYSDDESSLQFFTAILTRSDVTAEEKDKIQQSKIILGENILVADTNQQQQKKREEFKQKIQKVLQQKFKGKQELNYKQFWSEEPMLSMYLKIISALRFEAKWRDGNFKKIGKHKFTSFDNQQLTVDYMKNKITGSIAYSSINKWKSVRIFYENNYALDIVIPQEETKYQNTDKIKIITDLIKYHCNSGYQSSINLQMPLFSFKKKNNITNMLQETIPFFKSKDIKLEQECIIKVDEEGTIAEAITAMCTYFCGSTEVPKNVIIDNGFYYILSEVEKIEESPFNKRYELKNIIMIGAVNNPLVKN
jgi:serine protease inhibitor